MREQRIEGEACLWQTGKMTKEQRFPTEYAEDAEH